MQMHYEVAGEGSPLLLLYFFGGCAPSWRPHIELLTQHYRLIIPDLSTITAQTFIVHGDRDAFFPVNIPVDMYVAIPNAYL